ncbi:MAG: epoxyqueuosine reductase [Chloroflexi bacterium]|jgi:epoxyqueuosine reductase|nr:MAG: epoxyqueuosine reductase [Chloroflexota bacterium]
MTTTRESNVKTRIVSLASNLGFDIVRITTADPFLEDSATAIDSIRKGYMDGMPWYNENRVGRAADPKKLLPGAKSIIVVAMSYLPHENFDSSESSKGKVARYAQWQDYHLVMKRKLKELSDSLPDLVESPSVTRIFVDDGSFLERAAARRAGIGWFGKNSNILTTEYGSWVFLGALITDLDLEPDRALKKNCGSCVTCLIECPTGAIVSPYIIDATRCISYLTIENRGPIPIELRPLIGNWIFGCDICQEVCPVNRGVSTSRDSDLMPKMLSSLELVPLLNLTQGEFSSRFKNWPIKRAKLEGLKRNACVALGNSGDARAVSALGRVLFEDTDLVKQHAAWALGRIGGGKAKSILFEALARESDRNVRREILSAINSLN